MTRQQPPGPPPPVPPAPPPPESGWQGGSWVAPKPIGPAPGVVYASAGTRLGAFIIDWVILGFALGAVFAGLGVLLVLGAAASGSAGSVVAVFALLPLLVLSVNGLQGAYYAVSWYRGGATPGMRILGIRVVRSVDGGPLTKQQAILRTVGYWVSGAVLYLGFLWILVDDRRQGWHDKIADTLVVEAR